MEESTYKKDMSKFKDEAKQTLLNSLGILRSLRISDPSSMTPEQQWADITAEKLENKFNSTYVPFVSEVEEFNEVMGKDWQNRKEPAIDEKDADFVISFIQEELDELKEAVKDENVIEVLDAILDITYVCLGNGAMVFGLKDKIWKGYQEVQASNLSKVCQTEEEAKETVKVRSEEQGEPCHYEKVGDKFVVYRSSDNKVMKSINYFRPNLKQFFE